MDNKYWRSVDGKLVEVPPIKELCTSLEVKFHDQEERIKRLEEENKKLKDECWKDEEMAQMKEKYEKMHSEWLRGFPISEEESKKINEWRKTHHCPYRGMKIGSSCSYHFSTTAVGVFGEVRCSCGEKLTFQEP